MVRIFEVKEFAERKKLLCLQSEIHRQTMRLQIATAQHSLAQAQKRFAIVGISSLALSLGASVAGLFAAKKHITEPGKKTGFLAKIMSGVSVFNQAKSFLSRMKNPPEGSA